MASVLPEEQEFQWIVGQLLTPGQYARLGDIWEVGQVWLSNKIICDTDSPEPAMQASQLQATIKMPHVIGGKRREGLAKEEDLFHKEPRLDAKLFGKNPPKKS